MKNAVPNHLMMHYPRSVPMWRGSFPCAQGMSKDPPSHALTKCSWTGHIQGGMWVPSSPLSWGSGILFRGLGLFCHKWTTNSYSLSTTNSYSLSTTSSLIYMFILKLFLNPWTLVTYAYFLFFPTLSFPCLIPVTWPLSNLFCSTDLYGEKPSPLVAPAT